MYCLGCSVQSNTTQNTTKRPDSSDVNADAVAVDVFMLSVSTVIVAAESVVVIDFVGIAVMQQTKK